MCLCLCVDDSDSVEGVSALVAEFVSIGVLHFLLAAVRTLVHFIHRGKVYQCGVSPIGAVVRGEEFVEGLNNRVNGSVQGVVSLVSEAAEDADRKVTLVEFVVHVCECLEFLFVHVHHAFHDVQQV